MSDYQNLHNPGVHRGGGMSTRGLLVMLGVVVLGFVLLANFMPSTPAGTETGAEAGTEAAPAAQPATETTETATPAPTD